MSPPVGPEPCRLCHRLTFLADSAGPVHACCERAEAAGKSSCLACNASAALNRKAPR